MSKINSIVTHYGQNSAMKVAGPAVNVMIPAEEGLASLTTDRSTHISDATTAKTNEAARSFVHIFGRVTRNFGLKEEYQEANFLIKNG
jgi:hypothetical protein